MGRLRRGKVRGFTAVSGRKLRRERDQRVDEENLEGAGGYWTISISFENGQMSNA